MMGALLFSHFTDDKVEAQRGTLPDSTHQSDDITQDSFSWLSQKCNSYRLKEKRQFTACMSVKCRGSWTPELKR